MTGSARLVLASDRSKVAPLDPGQPLTIGRAVLGSRRRLRGLARTGEQLRQQPHGQQNEDDGTCQPVFERGVQARNYKPSQSSAGPTT